jgi:hypothetical protein
VVTDGDGFQATSRVVDVRANGTPTLAAVAPVNATEGGTVNFRVTATDPDNDPLTFAATGLPANATFNTTTGEFAWSGSVAGTYSISITASDGTFTSAAQTVTLTVTAPRRGGGGAVDPWLLLILAAGWWWARRRESRVTA